MFYEPAKNDHNLARNPFKSCTVPRAIGWISTKNQDGTNNLAPYSQFTNLTFNPPLVLISLNQSPNGESKNTAKNIERTGEFVYNMVTYDLRNAMNLSSAVSIPDGMDKFSYAGVTPTPCRLVDAMRVAESPIQYECQYVQSLRIPGDDTIATVDCIIGRVVGIHIQDQHILPDGKVDIESIRPLARLGYYDYTVVEKSFEMPPPPESTEIQHIVNKGLEGVV